jgi:hypothetical protein
VDVARFAGNRACGIGRQKYRRDADVIDMATYS